MSNDNVADPAAAPVLSYAFGPFRIDVAARHLLRDDAIVPLTAKVFDTLLVLVKHHNRAVSKEELIHAVWPGSFVSDDSLVQNISALRRALGDDPSQPRYIATLARRGYRFVAPTLESTEPGVFPPAPGEDPGHIDHAATAAATESSASRRTSVRVAAAFAAGLVVAAIAFRLWTPADATTSAVNPIRFRENLPPGQALIGSGALSSDSRRLAFIARDRAGVSRLWVRELGAGAARSVAGTDGAAEPFWSPDSQFIGFFADAALKRVGLSADAPRVLAATQRLRPLGGTWSQSDLLLYADQGKVFSVDASGGTPAIVLEPDPGPPAELRWPQFLPDGRHFLVSLRSENPERSGLYLATLGSRDTTRLISGTNTRVIYSAPGYLLYVRERALLAQPFDAARGQLQGDPMTVAGDVAETAVLSSTPAGLLSFSEETIRGRLVWLSRAGRELGTINVPKILSNIALSPNNKQLLGSSVEAGNWVMWLIDLDRNVSTQTGAYGSYPAWAPDGSRFAFSSVRAGEGDVFVKSITGATEEVPWLKSDAVKLVNDWSSDGRFIVFTNNKRRDLWLLPTFGERKPWPFTQSVSRARNGKVSPDGQWIAYVSDETGKMEVYVESFPAPGSKQRLSTNGGTQPIWRQDGHELFYLSDDHQMMAVPIQSAGGLQPGKPQPLFSAPDPVRQVVVTRDGHRFLVSTVDPSSDQGSITVLTNWQAAQRR